MSAARTRRAVSLFAHAFCAVWLRSSEPVEAAKSCNRLQAYAHLDEVRLLRAAGHEEQAIAVLTSPNFEQCLQGNPDLEQTRSREHYELHKAWKHFEQALVHRENLARSQVALLTDQAARLQRVLLARLDLEQAKAAAERSRMEAQTERLPVVEHLDSGWRRRSDLRAPGSLGYQRAS